MQYAVNLRRLGYSGKPWYQISAWRCGMPVNLGTTFQLITNKTSLSNREGGGGERKRGKKGGEGVGRIPRLQRVSTLCCFHCLKRFENVIDGLSVKGATSIGSPAKIRMAPSVA